MKGNDDMRESPKGAQASLAMTKGASEAPPTLDFLFLVYQDGDSWIGRSILTSHVSEGPTFDAALAHLTRAIDFAIGIAEREGYTVEQWYEDQEPDGEQFVQMFKAAVRTHEEHVAPNGRYIRRETIAKKRAA